MTAQSTIWYGETGLRQGLLSGRREREKRERTREAEKDRRRGWNNGIDHDHLYHERVQRRLRRGLRTPRRLRRGGLRQTCCIDGDVLMRELLIWRANAFRVNALGARILYSKTVFIYCPFIEFVTSTAQLHTFATHAHTSARVHMRVSNLDVLYQQPRFRASWSTYETTATFGYQ